MRQEGRNIKAQREKFIQQERSNLRSSFIEDSRGKIMSELEHAQQQQQKIEEEKIKSDTCFLDKFKKYVSKVCPEDMRQIFILG